MSSSTLRILGYVALALSAFAVADGAEAGLVGSDFASFGRLSPVQTVQFGGSNCYYADGWNGRGWYQCGNEWNDGFGWIGPFNLNTFGGSANRRHHRVGVAVPHPTATNPVYPRLEPSRRLGAGGAAPSVGLPAGGAPAFQTFHSPGFRRFGAGGVHASPNFRAGAATVTHGFAGGGFHGGLGGGNFHQFHGARRSPRRRACLARLCWRRLAWAWRGHRSPHRRACLARLCWRRRFAWAWRSHRSAHRRACLPGFYRGRRLAWAWRSHRRPHRRARLPGFCGRRDFPCRRRDGSASHRRASLARLCWRRVSWRRRGRSFPRRRRGVRTRRHRTSLSAGRYPSSVGLRALS